ncbi:MAG: hypothetical protein JWM16_541 [Verrucomicrobiales bacterium]|nr:hypothetical protein [Verrucomicrobiales bacterium]
MGIVFVKKAIWRCWLTRAVPTALGLTACTSAVHSFLLLPSRRKSPSQTAAGMLSRRAVAPQASTSQFPKRRLSLSRHVVPSDLLTKTASLGLFNELLGSNLPSSPHQS